MYRSIRILQLVCPLYSAPLSSSSWQKGTFTISDKSTKKVNLKVTVLLLPGFPANWITPCMDMWNSLWFNFMSLGHVLANLLSIRSQVNVWHQTARTTMHATLHCCCSNRAPSLHFLLVILDTFPTLWNSWKVFKMHMTSLEETAFPAAGSVLC